MHHKFGMNWPNKGDRWTTTNGSHQKSCAGGKDFSPFGFPTWRGAPAIFMSAVGSLELWGWNLLSRAPVPFTCKDHPFQLTTLHVSYMSWYVMICLCISIYFHSWVRLGTSPVATNSSTAKKLPLGSTEVQIYIARATFNRGLGVLFGGSLGVLEQFPTGFAFFGFADSVIPTVFFCGDPKSICFPVKNNPTMLHHILDWLSSLANTRRRGWSHFEQEDWRRITIQEKGIRMKMVGMRWPFFCADAYIDIQSVFV